VDKLFVRVIIEFFVVGDETFRREFIDGELLDVVDLCLKINEKK
jgi:hypothetical protein